MLLTKAKTLFLVASDNHHCCAVRLYHARLFFSYIETPKGLLLIHLQFFSSAQLKYFFLIIFGLTQWGILLSSLMSQTGQRRWQSSLQSERRCVFLHRDINTHFSLTNSSQRQQPCWQSLARSCSTVAVRTHLKPVMISYYNVIDPAERGWHCRVAASRKQTVKWPLCAVLFS